MTFSINGRRPNRVGFRTQMARRPLGSPGLSFSLWERVSVSALAATSSCVERRRRLLLPRHAARSSAARRRSLTPPILLDGRRPAPTVRWPPAAGVSSATTSPVPHPAVCSPSATSQIRVGLSLTNPSAKIEMWSAERTRSWGDTSKVSSSRQPLTSNGDLTPKTSVSWSAYRARSPHLCRLARQSSCWRFSAARTGREEHGHARATHAARQGCRACRGLLAPSARMCMPRVS